MEEEEPQNDCAAPPNPPTNLKVFNAESMIRQLWFLWLIPGFEPGTDQEEA